MESVDKFAPLKRKRSKHKKSPWITDDLLRQIHKRNYHKKLAVNTNDTAYWQQYKNVRNQTNNDIKTAKKRYFIDNLELNKSNPRKTWSLINELSSRKYKSRNISEIKTNDQTIIQSPTLRHSLAVCSTAKMILNTLTLQCPDISLTQEVLC